MIGFGELLSILFAMVLPAAIILYVASRYFGLRERKLELEAGAAAEKAAQYAARNESLEQRVRVLEQIVTDHGAQTAAQIEALRSHAALPDKKVDA